MAVLAPLVRAMRRAAPPRASLCRAGTSRQTCRPRLTIRRSSCRSPRRALPFFSMECLYLFRVRDEWPERSAPADALAVGHQMADRQRVGLEEGDELALDQLRGRQPGACVGDQRLFPFFGDEMEGRGRGAQAR